MLEAEREAVRTVRTHPWLLAGGAVVAAAWVAVQVAVVVPVTLLVLPKRTQPVIVVPIASLLAIPVLPPVLAGLYATVRETRATDDRPGPVGTLRLYGRGCLRHAVDLTTATVAFRAVAVVPALGAFVLLLAGDTALNYVQYATQPSGVPGPFKGSVELLVVICYGMVASGIGRLAFAFYDLPVLFGDVSPWRGWRSGLWFARRRWRELGRYGGGRILLWTPMLVVVVQAFSLAMGSAGDGHGFDEVALFAGSALAIGTVVTTTLAVHHVAVYERTVEPMLADPAPTGRETSSPADGTLDPPQSGTGTESVGGVGRAALVLAVLVVVATAIGTAAVRVDDVRPMPASERPVDASMDAEAVGENAERVLANASYRSSSRTTTVNRSSGERMSLVRTDVAIDRRTRRARVSAGIVTGEDSQRARYYGSETTLALDFPGEQDPSRSVGPAEMLAGRVAGEWGVMHYAGYPWVAELAGGELIDTEERDLRVLERTDDRVVVGYTDRPAGDDTGDDGLVVERGRLVVDRDTGRPLRYTRNRTTVEREDGTVVARHTERTVRRYMDYGAPAVRRPAPAPPPGPREWLWDYAYY